MIYFTTLPLIFIGAIILTGTRFHKSPARAAYMQKEDIMSCAPAVEDIAPDDNGKFIPPLPGWGHHSYPISTKNDSAQFYFNQGLNFYFSYHFREALASFRESARFDNNCTMAYWGQALAMGPYYNNYYYKMRKEVPDIIKAMNSKLENANEKEKTLVQAMQQRYSDDITNADRSQLDSNYAAAMYLLVKQYPTDNDIKALYIDAVMLEHKWDFWHNDGTPKAWTPELVKLCEQVLKNNPAHPAALHYYIHLTEASKHPELALPSAEVLKDVMPGVGHMVHMSTHMYQRNGLFAKGVYVNEDANNANNHVDVLAPKLGIGQDRVVHIYAVQSFCALNAGMYSKGKPLYLRARNRLLAQDPEMENEAYSQGIYMLPVIALIRLGKWQEILDTEFPDPKWKYSSVLNDFARGLANVHQKNIAAAKENLRNLELNLQDSLLSKRNMPFNKPIQCGNIAAGILKGEILYEEGKPSAAIAAFEQAVVEEDKLIYREPQEWMLPARHYLGAYLLKMKKAREAEKVYREDLVLNPANGWSLLGMYQSLLAQNRKKEAAKYRVRYIKAFKYADVKPVASVF